MPSPFSQAWERGGGGGPTTAQHPNLAIQIVSTFDSGLGTFDLRLSTSGTLAPAPTKLSQPPQLSPRWTGPPPAARPSGGGEGHSGLWTRDSRLRREVLSQLGQAGQVVSRREDIDVLEGRAHASCERTVVLAAQQRVEPNHLAGSCVQFLHRRPQYLGVAGIQTITEDQHDRVAVQQFAGPLLVEGLEAVTDSSPARPIVHVPSDAVQRVGDLFAFEVGRYARQRGAENK